MADHNLFKTFFLSPFFRFSNNLSPACFFAIGPSVNGSFDTSSLGTLKEKLKNNELSFTRP